MPKWIEPRIKSNVIDPERKDKLDAFQRLLNAAKGTGYTGRLSDRNARGLNESCRAWLKMHGVRYRGTSAFLEVQVGNTVHVLDVSEQSNEALKSSSDNARAVYHYIHSLPTFFRWYDEHFK